MPGTYSSPAESGFYYLKTRYYDPSIGRFISSDVYLSTGQGVLGNNSYAYCLNDSVNNIDSEGQLANTNVMEADSGESNKTQDFVLYNRFHCKHIRHKNIMDKIIIKNEDEAQFLIKECFNDICYFEKKGMLDDVCSSVARTILDRYFLKHGKDFFANEKELIFETKEHIVGYFWSEGYKGYDCPIIYTVYYRYFAKESDKLNQSEIVYVHRKCETVEYCKDSPAENFWYYDLH